ncbi:proton-conducting transporter membrane subunit [Pyrobaculum neutrophilum]|uniref:NADH/Ubiquinone/plastoquinone (Complex I) n=1 Tax=Pyrobaculum neutrophilum (strain DSM 2338 / JCM 9278 / NBRC 100436 / V24Sta) TaxID=444157 RepID=B1YB17_PYRNV|nr:proton-conducting transporter membrane subunit [Pyrobaculum neutrophilum]ACB40717.1 NADH/Ubiquinone/plastoquinone (complex I) [Pyrobaculum neutrophilum V24Sta]
MATLELLLALAYAAALADLLAARGYAAVAASAAFLLGVLLGVAPSTPYLTAKYWELAAFVAGIYLTIVVYSHFYMRGFERPGWFWGWMGVFFASMELFLLADHWALLVVGWAGLDLASWGLILTYRDGYEMGYVGDGEYAAGMRWLWPPSASALRAILTVEVGTAALLIGLAAAAAQYGDFMSKWGPLGDVAAALILLAAFVKAAQLPFTDWLMTAMSAPTPVSALLHSSTMVKAGPILLLKLGDVMPHWAAGVALAVGAATAFVSGLIALGQREPKLMLAASTASYLGMITALALEKPHEALLLIYAHGFAKATLFMAVGHAIHASHSRFPEEYPLAAKAAVALSMLTLLGITPLGALAKNDAPLWTLAVSALTAGYLGKLLRKPAAAEWEPMWVPYLALVVAPNFLLFALPKPVLFLSLAGLALAFAGEPAFLKRRLYLPVLFDRVGPALYRALWRALAGFDGFVDRALRAAAPGWRLLVDVVTVVDWLVDTALHGGLVDAVRRASVRVSGLRLDYYLYVVGIAVAFFLAVALWRA